MAALRLLGALVVLSASARPAVQGRRSTLCRSRPYLATSLRRVAPVSVSDIPPSRSVSGRQDRSPSGWGMHRGGPRRLRLLHRTNSMWGEDEMPMGDFSDLDPESMKEFKKKMQISDKEWAEMGLPSIDEERTDFEVVRTEDDEKLDQQAFQYVVRKLKEFRSERDMGPVELKLVLMAGLDAKDAAQMTYEDEREDNSEERNGMISALEEIIEKQTIPRDRDSLRLLATELAQMPMVNPEDKTKKMKKISAMEQGREFVEEEKSLTPRDIGGVAAVWGVTAVPVVIGLIALYILYSSSGTQLFVSYPIGRARWQSNKAQRRMRSGAHAMSALSRAQVID
eukprot:jgi/Bigna1/87768/estExt_fgenesh1_pg.C_240016